MAVMITPSLCADLAARVALAGADLPRRDRRQGWARKPDGSIVTGADQACERALRQLLAPYLQGMAVIGEETAPAHGVMPHAAMTALIDPLDGTSAYADGRDDYSVNLALVADGAPVLGVLALPAQQRVLAGIVTAHERAAWCWRYGMDGEIIGGPEKISVRPITASPRIGLVSERHGDAESEAALGRARITSRLAASSASKFALIAEGQAELYPRYGATMAWDTAAGQALLEAAGGCVIDPATGWPLRYPAGQSLRNGPFIAASDMALARQAAGLHT